MVVVVCAVFILGCEEDIVFLPRGRDAGVWDWDGLGWDGRDLDEVWGRRRKQSTSPLRYRLLT